MATTLELTKKLGKEPVEVKVDVPGFLANRLMIAVAIEAIKLYEQGIASKEDVDKAAKLGLNYPMGPFELMDLTGIDINYHVMDYFHKELPKELKWDPPPTDQEHGEGRAARQEDGRRMVRLQQIASEGATWRTKHC